MQIHLKVVTRGFNMDIWAFIT